MFFLWFVISLHKKNKFSINNFFSKFVQIRWKRRIWSHLMKKSLMENLIFCAVSVLQNTLGAVFNSKMSFVIIATKWPASADSAIAIVSDAIGHLCHEWITMRYSGFPVSGKNNLNVEDCDFLKVLFASSKFFTLVFFPQLLA